MTDKDALELLNMFTTATQIAKARNKYEVKLKFDEVTLAEMLRRAFPKLEAANSLSIAKEIIEG